MTSIGATRPTPKMRRQLPIRLIAATVLSASALSHAQSPAAKPPVPASTLSATPPTPAIPLTPSQRPPQRAKVTYTDNQITVGASNASLNQILHDISRLTGMKITGGVTDERVFGDYGPASPSQILATLLNGTSSNMLLVQNAGNTPAELILTPRQGGPTPPNPNAQTFDEGSDSSEEAPPNPVPRSIRHQAQRPYAPSSAPSPSPQTDETPAPAPQDDSNGQPTSPNGVKTPQQIYDELQRLRQQQQQQPK